MRGSIIGRDTPLWKARNGRLSEDDLASVVKALRVGAVVVVPTETVYGLAVDPAAAGALEALAALKQRPADKQFPLQVASIDDLARAVGPVPRSACLLFGRFSPGPITVVFRTEIGSTYCLQGGMVGVRIPDHSTMLAILRACGRPLAVTSANVSGYPPAITAAQAIAAVPDALGGVVDAGPCRLAVASTVVQLDEGSARILRSGAIGAHELQVALQDMDPECSLVIDG
jgi:L-threonylcarbamoyladenylate synthase